MPSGRYQTLKFVADIDIDKEKEKEKEIDIVIEIVPDIDTVPGRDKETVSDSAFFALRFFHSPFPYCEAPFRITHYELKSSLVPLNLPLSTCN